jgi:amino acid transporter
MNFEAPSPLRQAHPGHLVALPQSTKFRRGLPGLAVKFKHVVVGAPLPSEALSHQRITKAKALAIFASDALSSVAYATDEILLVLAAAGTALMLSLPIALAIVFLLSIVALSYRQTIKAYPQGGGTYIVTKDNLGATPSLVAGSALMIDYVLTVAVSVAAGVAALSSAWPAALPYQLPLALGAVAIVTMTNLRGIRESAALVAAPTYVFIISIFGLLAVGAWKVATGQPPVEEVAALLPPATEGLGVFLVLRAFAAGCSAMTGTEAISDGVPAFQMPQSRNAMSTLTTMVIVLGAMFLGITALAHCYAILPRPEETVISQLARAILGRGSAYYGIQTATALILLLAANTSFADFPRLASFLAHDHFLPRIFANRGDRLGFSTGILTLGGLSAALLVAFGAKTDHLIPLYAVGVFISFTLSQTSMVRRWWTKREAGWLPGIAINSVGALLTALVALVIMTTKFTHGAWMILVLLPLLVWTQRGIRRHYDEVGQAIAFDPSDLSAIPQATSEVVVPVAGLTRLASHKVRYALSLGARVTAVHVTDDPAAGQRLQLEWARWFPHVSLVIVESPYRTFLGPFLAYLATQRPGAPGTPTTVVLTEFVPCHWWQWMLHNQDALRLKVALFFVPHVAVVDVPFHLRRLARRKTVGR